MAEVLGRAGYRTAAVTDAGFFSRLFGQDQGFEWFEEVPQRAWNLEDTLARVRARMRAEDGRPLFLAVHTYRVVVPGRAADPGAPRVSAVEKPSIAVLAFNNMSGDSDQDYFADGIVEDITTQLSRLPGFFVIARNTAFTYKGRAVDVREVANELGVRYVM